MQKNFIFSIILASLLVSSGSIVQAAIAPSNYNSCYSAGEKAFATSDYVIAAENFAQALKYKPDDLRSRLKYAQSLYSLNKFDESSEHIEKVLQNSPNNIMARICMAENLIGLGKNDKAKEQIEWILKVQPNHQKAKSLLAKIDNNYSEETVNIAVPAEKAVDSESETAKVSETAETVDAVKAAEEVVAKMEKTIPESFESKNELKLVEPINAEHSDNASEQNENRVEQNYSQVEQDNSSIKKEEQSILNSSEEKMVFKPYIAGENKKAKQNTEEELKPLMPSARTDIEKTDLESFFKLGKDSFIVNLEKARYEIENGDLKSAEKTVELADKIARNGKNNRNIIETQIFKSLIYIYQCEYQKFGKHLMTLKPVLSTDTYQSFLDIYSKASELKDDDEKRRLAAGVAVGAGHFKIASSLLKPVFEKVPDDAIIYGMLSDAQLSSFDYGGAEETFKKYAELHTDNAEAQFNLARFYLTANYQPELSKKYAKLASELAPEDARCKIIIALTDYSEGKINEGIEKIKELLPNLKDSSMKAICERLISDGEKAAKDSSKNFITMLALPGSKRSDSSSFRFAGEDDLRVGSYFSALDKFSKADELVEMGRVYLGLASTLTSANEIEMASIAAGYGLKLINQDMSRGKHISRACLYKALYDYERGDKDSAIASIDVGLNCKDLDFSTYNKLVSLYDNLKI